MLYLLPTLATDTDMAAYHSSLWVIVLIAFACLGGIVRLTTANGWLWLIPIFVIMGSEAAFALQTFLTIMLWVKNPDISNAEPVIVALAFLTILFEGVRKFTGGLTLKPDANIQQED